MHACMVTDIYMSIEHNYYNYATMRKYTNKIVMIVIIIGN